MRLDEILQLKVDLVFKKYNAELDNSNKSESELSVYDKQKPVLNAFLNATLIDTMTGAPINLQKLDTKAVTDILVANGFYADSDIEATLRTIKVVLKAKSQNLKVELSNSQQMTLDSYIQNVKDCYTKIETLYNGEFAKYEEISERLKKIETELVTLRTLIEKILDKENTSILTEQDLEVVIEATKEMPVETRQEALIRFREYNHDRYEGNPKNNGKVDVEEFKNCFKEFGIDGPKLDRAISKNEEEIRESANIGNAKKILEYFDSVGILNKFEIQVLMTICIYGSYESCKSTFEGIVESNFDIDLCIPVPSVWIDNTRKSTRKTYTRKGGSSDTKEPTLRTSAHQISFKEYKANKDYLTSKGLTVNPDDVGIRRTMSMSNARLKEAVELFEQYGLLTDANRDKFKIYLLSTSNIADRLDKLVELGLLNGESDGSELNNYAKNFITTIHSIDVPVFSVLYKEKQTRDKFSYYDTIASTQRGRLSGFLTRDKLGNKLDTYEELEAFNNENFVDSAKDVENKEVYEEVISSSTETNIDPKVLEYFAIEKLEAENKVNDYVYRIEDVEISRLKVLRNFGALLKAGYNDSDAFFYSVVRGSLLTPESYEKVRNRFFVEVDFGLNMAGGTQ